MTGTSKALKRLGVAGLGSVVMFAGLVPLTELAANAAAYPITTATGVTLSPDTDTAANGTCNAFTVTLDKNAAAPGDTVSVNIQQGVAASTAAHAEVIGFCDPLATNPDTGPSATQAGPGTAGSNTNDETAGTAAAGTCDNTAATGTTAPPTMNVSCNTTYEDTNNDGSIVFGVTSNTPGTMSVNAFGDADGNGAQDVGESGDTSTKTWVANSQTSTTNKITCTPASASNPTSTQHKITCTVTDANGVALAGQNLNFAVTSGPDVGIGWHNGAVANAQSGLQGASCTATADGSAGTTEGQGTCQYTNNGQPGHDVISLWLETNGTPNQQAGEPSTTVTKDWITAAAVGSLVTVTCAENQTATTGTAPNQGADCQDPTSDTAISFTAKVVNGTPPTGQAGVLVQWSIAQNNGAAPTDTDTETLSSPTCTTDASGTCSVTLNNPTPTEGEAIDVTASVQRQAGGPTTATATKIWHDPVAAEARNVTVSPDSQNGTSGGAASFTATVTDRFGNPDANVTLNWTETGPGAFRSGTQCTTDATGKCSLEVTSLSTETGAETVTATVAGSSTTSECAAPADKSNYGPTGYNASQAAVSAAAGGTDGAAASNTATGAPAGTCADSGTVTWKAATPPPPSKTRITALINCFSPAKHVLKCKVKEAPAKAGLTVVFKRKTASGVHKIGVSVTNSNGVAKITKRHLKRHKIWRVFAHVRSTSTTTGATTGTDRTRIK